MTDTILITALSEGTGKTAIAAALGCIARDRGETVGYMKPLGTRLRSPAGKTRDEDPLLVAKALDLDLETEEMEPVVYSPSFITEAIRGQVDIDQTRTNVKSAFNQLASDRDRMLIEGGSSMPVGGIVKLTGLDLASLLDARVILVAEYTQGADLDPVLAAADQIEDRLAGVIFNSVDPATEEFLRTDAIPFLESRDVPVLGMIPAVPELAGVTAEELAAQLGAQTIVDAGLSRTVQQFIVGAMGADAAMRHFRRVRNAVVVTGGDRSDIQTAAIESPGISCLVLTGGYDPSQAVQRSARSQGVPILTVPQDTITTVENIERIVSGGRTRDLTTVDRMAELLIDHVAVSELLDKT